MDILERIKSIVDKYNINDVEEMEFLSGLGSAPESDASSEEIDKLKEEIVLLSEQNAKLIQDFKEKFFSIVNETVDEVDENEDEKIERPSIDDVLEG